MKAHRPAPARLPSWPALGRVALYWLIWLLVVRRLVIALIDGTGWVNVVGGIVAATAAAAWFTWIRLHDDRQERLRDDERARLRGPAVRLQGPAERWCDEDDDGDDGPTRPDTRILLFVVLGMGGLGCLMASALVPALRSELLSLGASGLVAAVLVLFVVR